MLGHVPSMYWRICWKFLSPAFLFVVIVMAMSDRGPLTITLYNGTDYTYPVFAKVVGWTLALSSVLMVPIVAIKTIMSYKGTFSQVMLKFCALNNLTLRGSKLPPWMATTKVFDIIDLPYVLHYNPLIIYFLPHFWKPITRTIFSRSRSEFLLKQNTIIGFFFSLFSDFCSVLHLKRSNKTLLTENLENVQTSIIGSVYKKLWTHMDQNSNNFYQIQIVLIASCLAISSTKKFWGCCMSNL